MKRSTARIIRPLLAATLTGIVFAPWASAAPAPPGVTIVEGKTNESGTWGFQPRDLTVKAGTTIVWNNKGGQAHTVAADKGAFDSGMIKPGASWKYQFKTPGEYAYGCTPHPWMTGIVRVNP
jgi:plastocyanin